MVSLTNEYKLNEIQNVTSFHLLYPWFILHLKITTILLLLIFIFLRIKSFQGSLYWLPTKHIKVITLLFPQREMKKKMSLLNVEYETVCSINIEQSQIPLTIP